MSGWKKGGGIGFLISEEVKYREHTLDLKDIMTLEVYCIEIKSKGMPVLLVTFYRPQNQPVQTSIKELKVLFKLVKSEKRPVVVCTDHNLDLLKASTHARIQEFLELTSDMGFLFTVSKPTRITHQSATIIDNIFISKEFSEDYKCWILQEDLSDHMSCLLSLPRIEKDRKHQIEIKKRKVDLKSINHIKLDMLWVDWIGRLENMNCEDTFGTFHDILMSSLDKQCPEKKVIKKGRKSFQPWISKGIKKSISKQRMLYKFYLENKSDMSNMEKYKNYKKVLQRTIRQTKKFYYSNLCTNHKRNTRKLWGIINSVLKKKPDKTSVIDCLEINKIQVFDSTQIVNELSTYFANVGELLAKRTKTPIKNIDYYNSKIDTSPMTMFLHPTDEREISKLIDKLKAKKKEWTRQY